VKYLLGFLICLTLAACTGTGEQFKVRGEGCKVLTVEKDQEEVTTDSL
jgi:hypothetical protein